MGDSQALPRTLNLEPITAGQEGSYGITLVMVITAVLKAVSLPGGHTVATELPSTSSDTSMGIKQSSSLSLAMYVCMYVCMYIIYGSPVQMVEHQTVIYGSTVRAKPLVTSTRNDS